MRQTARSRMLSEIAAALVCALIFYKMFGPALSPAYFPGAVLILMLLQGAGACSWEERASGTERYDEAAYVRAYRIFNTLDPVLIAVWPVLLIASQDGSARVFGTLADLLALEVYVSYFHVSLRPGSFRAPSWLSTRLKDAR